MGQLDTGSQEFYAGLPYGDRNSSTWAVVCLPGMLAGMLAGAEMVIDGIHAGTLIRDAVSPVVTTCCSAMPAP